MYLQTPGHSHGLRWDSQCLFSALWRMELIVSVTVYCASVSCWWQETTSCTDILYPLGVKSCFLLVLCFRIWLASSSINLQWRLMLLVFCFIWNIHLFKATVCFPVGLTGNGMIYVVWHNSVGTFPLWNTGCFAGQASVLESYQSEGILALIQALLSSIPARSALCYQSKPF